MPAQRGDARSVAGCGSANRDAPYGEDEEGWPIMRDSSFFDGIRQIELAIEGQVVKQPCFYFDSSSMTALFAARRSALRALMPDASYVPARLVPGLGIVAVVCYENRDTDVGPYNNVGIAVVREAPSAGNYPGRWAMCWLTSGESHAYVLHMPENSELPVLAGIEFLGWMASRRATRSESTSTSPPSPPGAGQPYWNWALTPSPESWTGSSSPGVR